MGAIHVSNDIKVGAHSSAAEEDKGNKRAAKNAQTRSRLSGQILGKTSARTTSDLQEELAFLGCRKSVEITFCRLQGEFWSGRSET